MKEFRARLLLLLPIVAGASLLSCSGDGDGGAALDAASSEVDASGIDAQGGCSDSDAVGIESEIQTILAALTADTDFSVSFENAQGRVFSYNRGASTLQTSFKSASTSKWVSAMIILRAVEQGLVVDGKTFSLDSLASDWIDDWPIDSKETLSTLRLRDTLNFSSGLIESPLCITVGTVLSFEDCVARIANNNSGNGKAPGAEFYYGGNHLQVAGMMTMKALGESSWQGVFDAFRLETGLFANSAYDLPAAASGPRLAGGMHWTADDYLAFVRGMWKGELLSTGMQSMMLSDQIASATIGNSPSLTGLQEDWHYGFGGWIECPVDDFNCSEVTRVSSPGAYGSYPFIDLEKGYMGIVARDGDLGTFTEGVVIQRAIATELAAWAECPAS